MFLYRGGLNDKLFMNNLNEIQARPVATYNTTQYNNDRSRISSVGRAVDSRAGGCVFNSRGRTNTQNLKITEGTGFPCPVRPFARLG